jgi:hypothetical protein
MFSSSRAEIVVDDVVVVANVAEVLVAEAVVGFD